MRFNEIDTISFTDQNGNICAIKDIRPISEFNTSQVLKIKKDDEIDEIASREKIFGDSAEGLSWALVDHNIEEIVEADFDLSKIKELKIPVLEEF